MENILIIDDEIHTCTLLTKILSRQGYTVEATMSGGAALRMIKEKHYQLVFCDYRLKDKERDGASLSRDINTISPQTAIVIMTGYPDVRVAIQLIKNGVYDYIVKPLYADQVVLLAKKAFVYLATAQQGNNDMPVQQVNENITATVVTATGQLSQFVYGSGNASKELHQQILLIAPTDYSVIISGETGTGKESVARLIHSHSKRSGQPFVAMDCGSLSKELAASELFGHEKGAFTGAINAKTGAFQQAHGGTLFLDEISNLSYDIQVALLRVMQERKVRPVGSTREIPIDIRIIVASNENLHQSVSLGKFREDLFYRLNEFMVNVPALRERLEDLPLFTATFIKGVELELERECGRLSDDVLATFYEYSWPGNIRELKNVIRRICLLTPGTETIGMQVLPEELKQLQPPAEVPPQQSPTVLVTGDRSLRTIAREAEHEKIIHVLQEVRFNKSKAARILNIDRKTLYNKLQSLNIEL